MLCLVLLPLLRPTGAQYGGYDSANANSPTPAQYNSGGGGGYDAQTPARSSLSRYDTRGGGSAQQPSRYESGAKSLPSSSASVWRPVAYAQPGARPDSASRPHPRFGDSFVRSGHSSGRDSSYESSYPAPARSSQSASYPSPGGYQPPPPPYSPPKRPNGYPGQPVSNEAYGRSGANPPPHRPRNYFNSDNRVDGLPIVTCGSDEMGIVVNTQRPFLGRIFVKGQSKRRECVREFLNNTTPEGGLQLPLSSCGMIRERKIELSPTPGLEESVTIVVSFHYVFVTAQDRAYKVICAYGQDAPTNTISVVTHGLNISHIPTIPVTPDPRDRVTNPPDCHYEIRRGGYQGPYALYAEVGEILFHRWSCDGPANMKILVKSCLVSDGEGEMFVVVDDRGCAVDPSILPDLSYDGNAAWVESGAFKFADTNFLGFSCTIQVCSDYDPPACSVDGYNNVPLSRGAYESKRLSDDPLPVLEDEVDVSAPVLNILDSRIFAKKEDPPPTPNRPGSLPAGFVLEGKREGWERPANLLSIRRPRNSGSLVRTMRKKVAVGDSDSLCLARFWVGLVAIVVGGLVLCALTALTLLFRRAHLRVAAKQRSSRS